MKKETPKINIERAVPEFDKRFPMEMAILRIGGVYPGEQTTSFENPYTKEQDNEYFGNVGEHCVAVAHAAEVMAKRLLGNTPDTDAITKRALVHDSTKKYEVMRKKAVKAGQIDDAYSESAYDTIKPLLLEKGVAPDMVDYMAHAGQETGHNSYKDFIKIEDGQPKIKTDNTADMIVHLADDMTHTSMAKEGEEAETHYVTVEERMELGSFKERYPFMYREGFGFDQDGKAVNVKDVSEQNELEHVKSYAAWMPWVANSIAADLVEKIDPSVRAEDAGTYLKNLVNNSLT